MNNKVYVNVSFAQITTKSLNTYMKCEVKLTAPRKNNPSKTVTLKLKPEKPISENKFVILNMMYDNLKMQGDAPTLEYEHVQARLYKGENYYGKYYYIKVFLTKQIILSCFLKNDDLALMNFMELDAEFSADRKEVVELEELKAI